ncbi:PAP2-domain-containing protein [Tilletiaria anomala UBC 951]|uniref:PAP2-domain-containing protein n=1 Tax=Tilletiaria anomala (strain ATCC 24038 / CBS 436.72 / UBC 951) TaxID=1037660 RepID=A0A066VHZ7_TILAU|nr:PAP2-domain-containing protein [Tilletiaria anomala UBC 951]KDN39928.1 PAP2-domain-containing protein [Tilletiaria anomala UBC 951]
MDGGVHSDLSIASPAGPMWRMVVESPRITRLQGRIASASRLPHALRYLLSRTLSAASRLETSISISLSLRRFREYHFSVGEKVKYAILGGISLFSLFIMEVPCFPLKLSIPALYALAILLPITSQFFLPAGPIFCWLLFFYSSKFIPPDSRPHIWVSLLPTLETIWYGASISDILTRLGHPALDILAWIPYGVVHFVAPFVVAACLFIFAPPGSVKVFGTSFGFMNLIGVIIQIVFPCAPPWYELREGLTPANYSMKGSPAGLARIDELFGGHGYTLTFSNAPVPFGAFPSLHAGTATMEALFCSYFFPFYITLIKGKGGKGNSRWRGGRDIRIDVRFFYWLYAGWLYWCTMYLMHHYLIDLVAGGCLATICFFFFLTNDMRDAMEMGWKYRSSSPAPLSAAPSPLQPGSAFGVRNANANGQDPVGMPSISASDANREEHFALDSLDSAARFDGSGDSHDSADELQDGDGDRCAGQRSDGAARCENMQMEPLLGAARKGKGTSRPHSKLRDFAFSAGTDATGSGNQMMEGKPLLSRVMSASKTA